MATRALTSKQNDKELTETFWALFCRFCANPNNNGNTYQLIEWQKGREWMNPSENNFIYLKAVAIQVTQHTRISSHNFLVHLISKASSTATSIVHNRKHTTSAPRLIHIYISMWVTSITEVNEDVSIVSCPASVSVYSHSSVFCVFIYCDFLFHFGVFLAAVAECQLLKFPCLKYFSNEKEEVEKTENLLSVPLPMQT